MAMCGKRKLPAWIMEGVKVEEETDEAYENACCALAILEEERKQWRLDKREDLLCCDDFDEDDDEEDECFSLSESSVLDVMTAVEATALIRRMLEVDGEYEHANKQGRLMADLRESIALAEKGVEHFKNTAGAVVYV
jgi:hypothetical protein